VHCPSDNQLDAYIAGAHLDTDIATHLDECTECVDVVAALVAFSPPEPKVGQLVGRYRLMRELGRGGMGVVFLAHDAELNRDVAIKVVRRRGALDSNLDARLRRESRLLARIRHPSVIAIYDVGVSGDNVFVAMELVRGTTLSSWLQAAPRSWREIVEVVRRAADGLSAAHEAGVLHRDVKPDNILIETRDGRVTRVIVSDFGVARPLDQDTPGDVPADEIGVLTAAGMAPGTLAYMAPEQLDGRSIDVRADVFALAVTAWEALYHKRPFAGSDRAALRAAIAEVPSHPQRSRVPQRIERALHRALDPDLARRTPSMQAFASQLAVSSRRAVIVGAAAVAIGAGAVAFAVSSRGSEPHACSVAGLDQVWPQSSLPAARSGVPGLVGRIDAMAAGWRTQRAELCTAAKRGDVIAKDVLDCLDRWPVQLDAELASLAPMSPEQPVVLADPRVCRGSAAHVLGLYVTADPIRQREVQQLRRQLRMINLDAAASVREIDALAPAITATQLVGMRDELALFRSHAARDPDESILRALAAQAEHDGDDSVAAYAWIDLSSVVLAGAPDAARAHDLLSIADAAIRRLGDDSELRADWHSADARAAAVDGDVERVHAAIDAMTKLDPSDPNPWAGAASALSQVGEPDAAVRLLEPRLARLRGSHSVMIDYGNALLEIGRSQDAIAALTEAVRLADVMNPQHVATALARIDLARAHIMVGDADHALAELARAAPIVTAPTAPAAATASYHELRGQIFDTLGRHTESLDALRAAVAVWTSAPHTDPKSLAIARINLGIALRKTGDAAAALRIEQSAVDDLAAAMGDANPFVANGYAEIGDTQARLGHPREARAAFEKSLAIYGVIPADPGYVGLAKRGLAFVLPATERKRALELAGDALAAWREHPSAWQEDIAVTDAWFVRHRGNAR